jgi:hypothetical protein
MARDLVSRATHATLTHVIAHELTHIRRRDYTGNLCQKFVRALFVFNPAAHAFDAWLDHAREVACDRDVIETAGVERRAYAQTLLEMGLRLREQWAGSPSIALYRHRSHLMRRMSCMRIPDTRDRALKAIVLGVLVAAVVVVIACSNTEEVAAPQTAQTDMAATENAAGHASGDRVYFTDADGKKVVIESAAGDWVTDEDMQFKLQQLMEKAMAGSPQHVSEGDLKTMAFKLTEPGQAGSADNGYVKAFFFDENGKRALVEYQGQWFTKEELQQHLQEQMSEAEAE